MKRRTLGLLFVAVTLFGAAAQTQSVTYTSASSASASIQRPMLPAANYVAVGGFYYEQEKFDKAYVAFRAATELDPRNTEALLGLGRSQLRLRLYQSAIETLRRLITFSPNNISGYIALAQAYQQHFIGASDRAHVRRNLEEALLILHKAEIIASLSPDKNVSLSKVWNERGYIYKLQGELKEASEAFKKAHSLNPDNDIILFNLGDIYYSMGDLIGALSNLQQAIIVDPRDAYNRAYYAKLLALTGNLKAAKSEAAQATRLAPNNAYVVGQYGVVNYLLKDNKAAYIELTKAVNLDPLRYPEFYYYLGRLALDKGDLLIARRYLTRAAALDISIADYAYYLGFSYERGSGVVAKDFIKARENYQRALKIDLKHELAKQGLLRVK